MFWILLILNWNYQKVVGIIHLNGGEGFEKPILKTPNDVDDYFKWTLVDIPKRPVA